MLNPLDAIAIAAEVFAWLTLPLGAVLLATGLARRGAARRRVETTAVVAAVHELGHEREVTLRWFGDGGAVHEMRAAPTAQAAEVGDARSVWVHPLRPADARADDPAHDGRALTTVGWMLSGTGAIALVLSAVLPLL